MEVLGVLYPVDILDEVGTQGQHFFVLVAKVVHIGVKVLDILAIVRVFVSLLGQGAQRAQQKVARVEASGDNRTICQTSK